MGSAAVPPRLSRGLVSIPQQSAPNSTITHPLNVEYARFVYVHFCPSSLCAASALSRRRSSPHASSSVRRCRLDVSSHIQTACEAALGMGSVLTSRSELLGDSRRPVVLSRLPHPAPCAPHSPLFAAPTRSPIYMCLQRVAARRAQNPLCLCPHAAYVRHVPRGGHVPVHVSSGRRLISPRAPSFSIFHSLRVARPRAARRRFIPASTVLI
ncbi:hypothetical protein HYPSUDRAFT_1045566 [Hypholoma sublateritium FD-334 SS-4]|uniref:Uncharacterized protein n=1 Tax=Hypholoma sublateritium (strain FD-334 SS-4) TaxID=945553 RepID=A0A0D2P9D9_HYPSF|nr:hypothetical protein HYPSUDRAFT_1045566 [Hypholoma sublateritium FD-334 SS-4]